MFVSNISRCRQSDNKDRPFNINISSKSSVEHLVNSSIYENSFSI